MDFTIVLKPLPSSDWIH